MKAAEDSLRTEIIRTDTHCGASKKEDDRASGTTRTASASPFEKADGRAGKEDTMQRRTVHSSSNGVSNGGARTKGYSGNGISSASASRPAPPINNPYRGGAARQNNGPRRRLNRRRGSRRTFADVVSILFSRLSPEARSTLILSASVALGFVLLWVLTVVRVGPAASARTVESKRWAGRQLSDEMKKLHRDEREQDKMEEELERELDAQMEKIGEMEVEGLGLRDAGGDDPDMRGRARHGRRVKKEPKKRHDDGRDAERARRSRGAFDEDPDEAGALDYGHYKKEREVSKKTLEKQRVAAEYRARMAKKHQGEDEKLDKERAAMKEKQKVAAEYRGRMEMMHQGKEDKLEKERAAMKEKQKVAAEYRGRMEMMHQGKEDKFEKERAAMKEKQRAAADWRAGMEEKHRREDEQKAQEREEKERAKMERQTAERDRRLRMEEKHRREDEERERQRAAAYEEQEEQKRAAEDRRGRLEEKHRREEEKRKEMEKAEMEEWKAERERRDRLEEKHHRDDEQHELQRAAAKEKERAEADAAADRRRKMEKKHHMEDEQHEEQRAAEMEKEKAEAERRGMIANKHRREDEKREELQAQMAGNEKVDARKADAERRRAQLLAKLDKATQAKFKMGEDSPEDSHLYFGNSGLDDPTRKKGRNLDDPSMRGGQYATLPVLFDTLSSGSPPRDAMTLAVWVYLSPDGREVGSKTIFATAPSGCGVDDAAAAGGNDSGGASNRQPYGWRLFVNSPDTANEELVLEYASDDFTSPRSKCVTLSSLGSQVAVSKWTHVGLDVDAGGNVKLYIDGKVVGTSEEGEPHGKYEAPQGGNDAVTSTRVGAGLEGGLPLEGAVANLAVWFDSDGENSSTLLRREDRIKTAFDASMDATELLKSGEPTNLYLFDRRRKQGGVVPVIDIAAKPGQEDALTGFVYAGGKKRGTKPAGDRQGNNEGDKNNSTPGFKPAGPDRFAEYKDGTSPRDSSPVSKAERQASDELALVRRSSVVEAMKHVWSGYEKYAWGRDELRPVLHSGRDNFGGMGVTLIDAMDTLWLMGLHDEFKRAADWVRDSLNLEHVFKPVSVFETTIRVLGGLLAARDLSGDDSLIAKADDLGGRLVRAFESPSGVPFGTVQLKEKGGVRKSLNPRIGGTASLAEFGTLQLEFRRLAELTGKKEYADKAMRVFDVLEELQKKRKDGLFPIYLSNQDPPEFKGEHYSLGANGDSAYEYFLKVWLQGERKEAQYRQMYDKAMQSVHDLLVQKSEPSGLTYVAEMNNGRLVHRMDHLVCFLGGLLALGAHTHPDGLESPTAKRDMKTGQALAYTCYQMYARMPTGLAPEYVDFTPKDKTHDFIAGDQSFILRPEALETFYILHRLTGDPVYRDWGWEVFEGIEANCRTDAGYGSVGNVEATGRATEDRMESFFLAETLKYLYLLMDPETKIDILGKHVLNTEAHPFLTGDSQGTPIALPKK